MMGRLRFHLLIRGGLVMNVRFHRRLATAAALLGSLFATAASSTIVAQEVDPVKKRLDSSPRHHEWVDIESAGGRKVRAFVAYPEVSEKAPVVLVIHENKGLTDWVRSVADQVAEMGYVAVAPDLLSGMGPNGGNTDAFPSIDAATQAIYALKPDQVTADLDAAAAYARKLEASNGKLVTMGFCWGGGQSFAYATHDPKLAAALVFYGTAPDEAKLGSIAAPVYGFYGGNDQRISGQVPRVTEAMKKAGKTYDAIVYEGAGHGFFRAGEQPGASAADKRARDEAETRVKSIFKSL
jgi:carboxymethylenebutenolidase